MKKLLLNRKPVDGPWGGGNLFVAALCDLAPSYGYQVVHDLQPLIDVIFLQDPRPGNTGVGIREALAYKMQRNVLPMSDVKIVHRVNECDARKGTTGVDEMLQQTSRYVDDTVFVSHWMREYHLNSPNYAAKRWHVIYNGVSHSHFRPNEKIDNGKVNIVAHHWSNNRMKGFDVYEAIDKFVGEHPDRFTFTYIGRENGTFKHTRVIAPLFGEALGAELGRYDVYVSGSLWDPGPNHVMEALACRIPTYVHADSGGAAEFAGPTHVYKTIDDLISILSSGEFKKNDMVPSTWEECIRQYFDVISA